MAQKSEFTDNARTVLEKRNYYQQGEKSPEDVMRRVAHAIAQAEGHFKKTFKDKKESIEKAEKQFLDMLLSRKFLPNSPVLYNAGTKIPAYAACFHYKLDDSMDSIFGALLDSSKIFKAGGGVGYNFSELRPAGDSVSSTSGVSSGPVAFMHVFDAGIGAIKQGGKRRGAAMGFLLVDHPDILEFIDCKAEEGVLSNFNISVALTDDFMRAVENDEEYDLINPRTGEPVATLKAAEVFDKLCVGAHRNGDPGVLFYDTMQRFNPLPSNGNLGVNPCVAGYTPILTDTGYTTIAQRVGKPTVIWNGYEWREVTPRVTGENQELVRVAFSDGSVIDMTPYHELPIKVGGYGAQSAEKRVQVRDAKPGMRLVKYTYPLIEGSKYVTLKEAYTRGVFSRWGQISEYGVASIKDNSVTKLLRPYLQAFPTSDSEIFRSLSAETWKRDWVPDASYTKETRLAYFAGVMDARCYIRHSGVCEIPSQDLTFLCKLKMMLHTLGVAANVGKTAYGKTFALSVAGSSMQTLAGLGLAPKRAKIVHVGKRVSLYHTAIVSITPLPEKAEKVYCFTETKRHTGMFMGVTLGQCGEQVLTDKEACNLGSINLAELYDPETNDLDDKEFARLIEIAVRFLDNVVELSEYPISEITANVKASRKIGLGVMGFADLLLKMGIPYNSEEGRKLARSIASFLRFWAEKVSRELARERGSFETFLDSTWHTEKGFTEMRNAGLVTLAPTGTLSIIANCSSGIEPVFAFAMNKQLVDGPEITMLNPELERMLGERYSEEEVTRLTKEILEVGSLQNLDIDPEVKKVFVCAGDISPEDHVRMQAAWQESVDSAVSKTINCPHTATVQDVKDAYMLAWKLGCKGVTIYRDGSKENQPLSTGKTHKADVPALDPLTPRHEHLAVSARPDETVGGTKKYPIGPCGALYITPGLSTEGELVEVFARAGKNGGCESLVNALARVVSTALRMECPDCGLKVAPKDIIEQLQKTPCMGCTLDINTEVGSCPDAIGKSLLAAIGATEQKWVSPLRQTPKQPLCPDCGKPMQFKEGCQSCPYCGWSKCS